MQSAQRAREFEAKFQSGGHIEISAAEEGKRLTVSSVELTQMLRRYSQIGSASPRLESVVFKKCDVEGDFDLRDAGTAGDPIVNLTFDECSFPGNLVLKDSFLRALSIRQCDFTGARQTGKGIMAAGVHILQNLLIESCPETPEYIDFSDSVVGGGCSLTHLKDPLKKVTFARAKVADLMEVNRLEVTAGAGATAFDADELAVSGTLRFCDSKFSGFVNISLRGARVNGQLVFDKVSIETIADTAAELENRYPLALMAEGLSVGGDLFFRGYPKVAATSDPGVKGQIDLVAANIGGDVHIYGSYSATEKRMRAFKALHMKIGGDLRFGWIPGGKSRSCQVVGECDFSGATVTGEVFISGSTLEFRPDKEMAKVRRRKQGQALNLRNIVIGGDLRIQGSPEVPCKLQGLSIIGAKIAGRLLVRGSTIEANVEKGERRKAITANGSSINGGIEITEDEFDSETTRRGSEIKGDFRLRGANVGGPVIFRGVTLSASEGGSGIALWASNSRFASDVVFTPYGKQRSTIKGELKFWSATIGGTLWVRGVDMSAGKTAAALDCYAADIQRGVVIGDYLQEDDEGSAQQADDENVHRGVSSTIRGIVSFNFSRVQSLTLGNKHPNADNDKGEPSLTLIGVLLMRDIKVQGGTFISDVLFEPVERKVNRHCAIVDETELNRFVELRSRRPQLSANESEELADLELRTQRCKNLCEIDFLKSLNKDMQRRLEELGVHRQYCIVHANYASLGSRFFVRLHKKTVGLITLYGASACTIGALSGQLRKKEDGQIREYWGRVPERGRFGRSLPRAEHPKPEWACECDSDIYSPVLERPSRQQGKSREENDAFTDVLVNLDEFTYQRVSDRKEDNLPQQSRRSRLGYTLIGRPKPEQLRPRYDWIQRQAVNPGKDDNVVLSPYRQLAKVYSEMGDLRRSYYYIRERRWLQTVQHGWVRNVFFEWPFSIFFGFGYSAFRAVVSLLLLYGLSVISFEIASYTGAFLNGRACDIPVPGLAPRTWAAFNAFAEGFKLIVPFARSATNSNCSLSDGSHFSRLFQGCLQFVGWIFLPLAAITLSGILREKHDQ